VRVLGLSFLISCAECRKPWVDDERWRAYLGVDEHLDESAELAFYPRCAEREFGGD
jgi:hypothetical protein